MYVNVILPIAIPTPTLTYECNEEVGIGCRVSVRVGRSGKIGVGIVLSKSDEVDPKIKAKMRRVEEVLDRYAVVPQVTLDFWIWISQYYMAPLGEVVRTQMVPILSKTFHFRSPIKRMAYRVRPSIGVPEPLPFDLHTDSLATLIVEHSEVCIESLVEDVMTRFHTDDEGMILILAPNSVTSTALAQHLSKWWSVDAYNSTTTIQRRGELYTGIAMGITPRIVVGTKGALSLPARKWDAIIVLDAHDNVYKSDRQPNMWAKDAAIYLASLHKAKCYLLTPTPTVEMYYNAMQNKWNIIHTPNVEDNLKSIVLERGKNLISKYLQSKIEQNIVDGKMSVIFQNRRGYSSWVECPKCGNIPFCDQCSAPMGYHLSQGALVCHHCNRSTPFDWKCPDCGATMEPYGRGTQRLQEQLQEIFPLANIARIDSDSVNLRIFKMDPKWNIVVGTQMLFDRRVKFDNLGVVAIANADNIASAADFRSNENRYQIVKSLADHCRKVGAEFIVQSSKVDDSIVQAALKSDFSAFYNAEIEDREANLYPPFTRLITIDLRGRSEALVFAVGRELENALRAVFGERLSPLYQPMVGKMEGHHIARLLLRIERSRSASKAKVLLAEASAPVAYAYRNDIDISYDVDPLF